MCAAAAGVAIAAFHWNIDKVRLAGFIPLAVGLALLTYAFVLAPRQD